MSEADLKKQGPLGHLLGRSKQPIRRPTLKGYIHNEPGRNRSVPPGQSFRFKEIYWGREARASSEMPNSKKEKEEEKGDHNSLFSRHRQRVTQIGDRLARSASRLTMWARTDSEKRKFRTFSQPSSTNLAHFEKPTEPLPVKEQIVKTNKTEVSKLTFMISEIMATGATQQQLEAEVRICCVIQVRMWPLENKVPLSTSGLIELIKMFRSWRRRAPDRPEIKPSVIMSHNGYSRCGIFIGANVCIDQMDMDHEVDMFHAVKMIRINRPQLIDMKDEYKYLYDLMLHWYMTNPEYRMYDRVEIEVTPEDEEPPPEEGGKKSNRNSVRSNKSISPRRRSSKGPHNVVNHQTQLSPVNPNARKPPSPIYLNDE
uniref:Uncharacterized protein n=1 Tax=Acrobeloides nanus TaxID=290746 RepID=A0A914DK35_9BILA